MAKERFLTVMTPIKDSDCEATVYADAVALATAVPPSVENINKVYKLQDGTYMRVWLNPSTSQYEYHSVTDREFPYLGNPIEIFDFTYDATRMGTAPTISAQGVMRYADADGTTLDGLWTQQCHVVFNGKKLYLKQIPTSSKSNEDARYKYDLDFVDERVALERVYFYDVVSPFITERPISESSTFSFYGDINELVKRINASLIRSGLATLTRKYVHYEDPYYEQVLPSTLIPYLTYEQWTMLNVNPSSLVPEVFGSDYEWRVFNYEIYRPLNGNYSRYLMEYIYENDNGVYTLFGYQCKIGTDKYGDPSTSEEKLINFENSTIHEALQQFHDTFGLEYYITCEKNAGGNFTGNTFIVIGDCEHDFADWDSVALDFVRDDDGVPVSTNPFDYGSTEALLSKEKTNTTDKIVTRITGAGSTENIPWYYPNPNPDGWIKPFYTEYGEEVPNVIIEFPTDEGETTADGLKYEDYLKNRIGVNINRGIVKEVIYSNEYNFAFPVPDEEYNILLFTYEIDTHDVIEPRITLKLNYNPDVSKCSRITGALGYEETVVGTYDSSESYTEPTPFQAMFITKDGFHKIDLVQGKNYVLRIVYYIPKNEMPNSRMYDYEGYHYPSMSIQYGTSSVFARIGENFYQEQGLQSFAEFAYPGVPTDAGYSIDGTSEGKVLPQTRVAGGQYKDMATGIIYKCYNSNPPDIQDVTNQNAFSVSPAMSGDEWFGTFVSMALSLYANDGWYIGRRKVVLSDYGIFDITFESPETQSDIFNAIEFKRLKWVTPIPNLMPEVFIKTDGERRFYNAHNYWDKDNDTLFEGTADPMIGEVQVGVKVRNPIYKDEENLLDDKHYEFESEYRQDMPHEHIEDFDDVKPSIEGQKNYVEVKIDEETADDWANQYQNYFTKNEDGTFSNATSTYDASETYYMSLRIDVVEQFAYDETDNNEIWDNYEDETIQGEYKHPYFFAKLRPMGFNIFDLALTEDMTISMTTGNCGACNFKIGVDENTGKNPVQIWEYDVYVSESGTYTKVYDAGTLRRYVNLEGLYYFTGAEYVPVSANMLIDGGGQYDYSIGLYDRYTYSEDSVKNGLVGGVKQDGKKHFAGDVVTNGRFIASQQDTSENYVWVALMKDTESYGVIMPSSIPDYGDPTFNQYIEPKGIEYTNRANGEQSTLTEDQADKFVLTNIRLPQIYLRRAEHKLSHELVKYMYEHNWQRFNFSIKFSRIYIENNQAVDEDLNENSVLYVQYDSHTYRQYVKHYVYKMSHEAPLPETSVDMNEDLSVARTLSQQWDRRLVNSGRRTMSYIGATANQTMDLTQRRYIGKYSELTSQGETQGEGGGQTVSAEPITEYEIDVITTN